MASAGEDTGRCLAKRTVEHAFVRHMPLASPCAMRPRLTRSCSVCDAPGHYLHRRRANTSRSSRRASRLRREWGGWQNDIESETRRKSSPSDEWSGSDRRSRSSTDVNDGDVFRVFRETFRSAQDGPQSDRRRREPNTASSMFSSLSSGFQRLQDAWAGASQSERNAALLSLLVVGGGLGMAVNALLHAAATLAFALIPVLLLPVMVAVASFGFAALMLLTVAGAGVFFIGAPVMVGSAIFFKVLAPLGVLAFVATRGAKMLNMEIASIKEKVTKEERLVDEPTETTQATRGVSGDDLSQFDRELEARMSGTSVFEQRSSPESFAKWTVQDCIDDLERSGLIRYADLFRRERIDGQVLGMMSDDEVEKDLCRDMPIGDKKRVVAWVRKYRQT